MASFRPTLWIRTPPHKIFLGRQHVLENSDPNITATRDLTFWKYVGTSFRLTLWIRTCLVEVLLRCRSFESSFKPPQWPCGSTALFYGQGHVYECVTGFIYGGNWFKRGGRATCSATFMLHGCYLVEPAGQNRRQLDLSSKALQWSSVQPCLNSTALYTVQCTVQCPSPSPSISQCTLLKSAFWTTCLTGRAPRLLLTSPRLRSMFSLLH